MSVADDQKALCARIGTAFEPPSRSDKVGIALQTLHLRPLNGLRHPAEHGTCGWYIWGGEEWSDDPEFCQPLHVDHLDEKCPDILPYLALPPGWRFLIDADYEDVWEDRALLEI